jgi:hypothetical protein
MPAKTLKMKRDTLSVEVNGKVMGTVNTHNDATTGEVELFLGWELVGALGGLSKDQAVAMLNKTLEKQPSLRQVKV